MIAPSFIQELLARVDIVDVVGRAVQLKKAGANFLGLCPFHGEKSPSFTVSPTKQFYHCFGCGAHGTAISFLIEHSGLGFVDAVKELAQSVGLKVPEIERSAAADLQGNREVDLFELMAKLAQFYKQRLRESETAISYLKQRGLSGEIAARYAIGYAPSAWRALEAAVPDYQHESLVVTGMVIDSAPRDAGEREFEPKLAAIREVMHNDPGDASDVNAQPAQMDRDDAAGFSADVDAQEVPAQVPTNVAPRRRRFDRFRERIMFPIRNPRGQVIGFGGRVLDKSEPKYMNSPETPLFSKGRELYGLFEARQALRQTDCAIVVEGYMDVVMLAQHGIQNAVATLGTATTPEHVQKLLRLVDRIVFAFDGDAAGRKAAWRALEACLPKVVDTKRIDFLFLPTEHDPDSYVREYGQVGFETLLSQAAPLSEFLVNELRTRADVDSAEGRAQLLALARPLLLALPPIALRLQLVHRIAEVGRIATSELESYLRAGGAGRQASGTAGAPAAAGTGAAGGRYTGAPAKPQQRGAITPIRDSRRPMPLFTKIRVLTALHPSLAKINLTEDFLSPQVLAWIQRLAGLPDGSSFAGLCEAIRLDDAALVEQLVQDINGAAALSECGIDEARIEYEAAILKLREEGLQREKKALADRGLASPQDRARFQFLLTVKLGG